MFPKENISKEVKYYKHKYAYFSITHEYKEIGDINNIWKQGKAIQRFPFFIKE